MTRTIHLIAVLASMSAVQALDGAVGHAVVDHYGIDISLDPGRRSGSFVADLTVRNTSTAALEDVSFVLYRLFRVAAAEYEGQPASFDQEVVIDGDSSALQVNRVRVRLQPAIPAAGVRRVRLTYTGQLHGYREVWRYVQDTIGPEYSLLRTDTFFYPVVTQPSGSLRQADAHFTYRVTACVPEGLVVAGGGSIAAAAPRDGKTCTAFTSATPTWRIDLAAARFTIQQSPDGAYRVYVLPGHEEGATRVLGAMRRAVDYYSARFGPPSASGYTAIEIPDGWGSQASDSYFLQSGAAFVDPSRIGEVYHELGHGFDIDPASAVQRARFFDEAFASYYESLAVAHFERGDAGALEREMDDSRKLFTQWAAHDQKYASTPIVEYARLELGQMSYSKGAFALYVLHQLIGDAAFDQLVRELRRASAVTPMDFERFQRIAQSVAGRELSLFFQEWFQGTRSSELLSGDVPTPTIVARYR